VTGYMLYYLMVSRPAQALACVALMLAGLVLYFIAQNQAAAPAAEKATVVK